MSPSYGMYEVSASVNDVEIIKIPLNEEFGIDYDTVKNRIADESLKLIIICSPNNPTGNSLKGVSLKRSSLNSTEYFFSMRHISILQNSLQ